MPRTNNHALICALGCPLLFFGFALTALASPDSKVDTRVWQDCDNNGRACFLVLLNEQSDTKLAADPQPDRLNKRRAVVNSLRDAARRGQSGILESAKRAGVTVRPYWLVNA